MKGDEGDGGPSGAGRDGAEGDGGPSPAERFRRRIAELEDRLESSTDDAEREALRRDIEHLRAGLRAMERSGDT